MTAQRDLDIPAMAKRLHASTCKLLGLNPASLSLAEKVRVDRASALRLQIDDLQAAQLRGAQIDINKLVEASEALERMIRQDAPAEDRALAVARAQFEELLNKHIGAKQYEENHECAKLREINAELVEENARLRKQLQPKPQAEKQEAPPAEQTNVVPIRNPSEPAWAAHYYNGGSLDGSGSRW